MFILFGHWYKENQSTCSIRSKRRGTNNYKERLLAQRSVHIIVKGRVQGVGYRWFVMQKAADFKITGWIINLPNQDVEIIAHGIKKDMETFIDWVKTGPARARVLSVIISDFISETTPDSFSVR